MAKTNRTNRRNKPVIPLGQTLGRTSFNIDEAAKVSEEDKLSALAFWEQYAPPRRRLLLRATERKRKVGP